MSNQIDFVEDAVDRRPQARRPSPILGGLRLSTARQLGGAPQPSRAAVSSALRNLYRTNRALAQTTLGLLTAREDLLLGEHELPSIEEAMASIELLERRPLKKFSFVSVATKDESFGLLFEKDELEGGGLIYVITMFAPGDTQHFLARLEIRAARTQPEPFASLLTSAGTFQHVSMKEAPEDPLIALAIRCLVERHRYTYRQIKSPELDLADVDPRLLPPGKNDDLERLCLLAYTDKLRCTRAIVPIDRIVPEDITYAINYPLDEIKRLMGSFVDAGQATIELLLYERNGRFMMGDDYPAYLSYKAMLFKRVPAVILGQFDSRDVEVLEHGGNELMPPLVVSHGRTGMPLAQPDLMSELDLRLAALAPPKTTSSDGLSGAYLEFCHLLAKRRKREADLHAFIERHPEMLDGHAAKVHSEVRIGDFRADLVLRYEQSDKRVVLVELEMDNAPIFNKKGRLRSAVVHASQQIEDWIGAIRANDPRMPDWLKETYAVEGLVVIGRSTTLDDDARKTLFNLNSNRVVKIITYDDLLERLNRLIATLDQANSD